MYNSQQARCTLGNKNYSIYDKKQMITVSLSFSIPTHRYLTYPLCAFAKIYGCDKYRLHIFYIDGKKHNFFFNPSGHENQCFIASNNA